MTKETDVKIILENASRIHKTILKEIDNVQNSGTLPKDIQVKMNLIKTGVTLLIKAINDKVYRQMTLDDYTTDDS